MVRPPLKAVAALANVSEPTVSRVLNGRAGVAEATRIKVVAALESLGFTDIPEPKQERRNVVGMICGEFANPVFPAFVHQISTHFAQHGMLTTVAVTDPNMNPEERCIREFLATGVDGIVMIGGRHAEVDGDLQHYAELIERDVPIVLVNGRATSLDAPHVRCDEEAGARKAVTHLIRLGHRKIGCLLGDARYIPTQRFISGYRRSMTEAGLPIPDGSVIETPFTLEGGRAGATRLMELGFTAMISGNDLMALGAVQAGADTGLSVPADLSVVGYDGTDYTALTNPPLTTLRQPFEDIARLVVEAMVSEIDGTERLRDHYVFEPALVARDTTGAVAVRSPATAR